MHLIITGSRDWPLTEACIVTNALHRLQAEGMTLLIHGGASGVDSLARAWAKVEAFPCVEMPACWGALGPAAGHIRNGWMLQHFPTADVLAFPRPNSRGTRDCIAQARALGRRVWVYGEAS